MTPKEKANELYLKFHQFTPAEDEFEHKYTKQCALIAVDEIIDLLNNALIQWHILGTEDDILDYWQQVKEEIQKL